MLNKTVKMLTTFFFFKTAFIKMMIKVFQEYVYVSPDAR